RHVCFIGRSSRKGLLVILTGGTPFFTLIHVFQFFQATYIHLPANPRNLLQVYIPKHAQYHEFIGTSHHHEQFRNLVTVLANQEFHILVVIADRHQLLIIGGGDQRECFFVQSTRFTRVVFGKNSEPLQL